MKKTIVYFSLLVNLVLVASSFLFNMGWLRVFALTLFVPYTIALTIINFLYVSKCFKINSVQNMKPLILTNGFYFLANIILPDFGDVEGSYAFFGLIKNVPDFFILVSITFAIAHMVFLVISLKEMRKMKKIQKVLLLNKKLLQNAKTPTKIIVGTVITLVVISLIGYNTNQKAGGDTKKIENLNEAIRKNNIKQIKRYIDSGINLNRTDTASQQEGGIFPESPLYVACEKSNLKIVKLLLENGAKPVQVKGTANSPLTEVFAYYNKDDLELAKLLIKQGADINYVEQMTDATPKGMMPILELAYSQPNSMSSIPKSEANEGVLEIFRFLDTLPNVDFNVSTNYGHVLTIAARQNNLPLLKYLIEEKKMDINLKDKEGYTALYYAAGSTEEVKMVEYLLGKGADKTIESNGKTPYDAAFEVSSERSMELLKLDK
ncbi:ankyrin repeat domain-containing protein [Gottfriedia sp. S16(2024)]|uniref:ankyrin repeat domain-containing protein n=1 Tax=Gottfriedia sp. S16(2024) TaxID=3162883 RepID=UPI003D239832